MNVYDAVAALYDVEHRDFLDDLDFYLRRLPWGRVLEVGAGTGRLLPALADGTAEFWGLEPSGPMLERARKRAGERTNVQLVQGAVPEIRLPESFDLIILPLNMLWHFPSVMGQIECLSWVRDHLSPDGTLLCDCGNPLTLADRGGNGEARQRFRSRDLTIWSAAWDDEADQRLEIQLTYDELHEGTVRRTQSALTLRYVYRGELEAMMYGAGLGLQDVFGWYDERPYEAQSQNLISVARRLP